MSFPAFFDEAVAEAGRDLTIAQATNGDSALLVDPNPRELVIAALTLRQRLHRSPYGCDLRFGGDAGFVEIAGEGRSAHARTGLALLVAARLEPHAPPGTILVTGQFVEAWRDLLGAGGLARTAGRAARGAALARERRPLRSGQAGRRGADAAAPPTPRRSGLRRVTPVVWHRWSDHDKRRGALGRGDEFQRKLWQINQAFSEASARRLHQGWAGATRLDGRRSPAAAAPLDRAEIAAVLEALGEP